MRRVQELFRDGLDLSDPVEAVAWGLARRCYKGLANEVLTVFDREPRYLARQTVERPEVDRVVRGLARRRNKKLADAVLTAYGLPARYEAQD